MAQLKLRTLNGNSFQLERERIAQAVEAVCSTQLSDLTPVVGEAIRYALAGPGKSMRGLLVMLSYDAAGGTEDVSPIAAAVEIIHTYSLVHDDLPCMDDDDVRRGRPSTHIAFGVPVATMAALAMIPVSVRAIGLGAESMALKPTQSAIIVEGLLRAAGAEGMIGGQLRDLRAEGLGVTLEQLEEIHRTKTGALIAASAEIGGVAAMASPEKQTALRSFGADLGLAFQIIDDVLDVTATSDQLGKTAGKDIASNKSTYPALLGVEGALKRADSLVKRGCSALSDAGLLTSDLQKMANLVLTRKH